MAVLFSDEAYAQYLQIARIVLGQAPSDLGIPFDPSRSTQNIQFIRVTSAGIVSGTVTFYPGRVRVLNASYAFQDAIASDIAWIIHPNFATLTTTGSAVYPAKQVQSNCDVNGDIRPLFIAFQRPLVSDVVCVSGDITPTIVG